VCTRGSNRTPARGPSTSPLDVMRVAMPFVALALAIYVSVGRGEETGIADLPFEVLSGGRITGLLISPPQLRLARDEIALRTMWAEPPKVPSRYYPGSIPSVDFGHWMVVAFVGGSHYRITQVIARPDKVTLHISHQVAGRDCVVVDAPQEYIIAKIPWTEKPIDFEIETAVRDCL